MEDANAEAEAIVDEMARYNAVGTRDDLDTYTLSTIQDLILE